MSFSIYPGRMVGPFVGEGKDGKEDCAGACREAWKNSGMRMGE
jgi:hypothetical protein